jgi:hypothetical protein
MVHCVRSTPPHLYLFKELMSYLHTVKLYSAVELGVADAIEAHTALYFPNGGGGAPPGVPSAAHAAAVAHGCGGAAAGSPASCAAMALRPPAYCAPAPRSAAKHRPARARDVVAVLGGAMARWRRLCSRAARSGGTGCAQPPAATVFFDRSHVIELSRQVWGGGGGGGGGSEYLRALLAARPALRAAVSHTAGDMFDPATLPRAAPGKVYAYMLRDILHDWPDVDCVRILASLRAAMGACARHRVMIVGRILVPGAGFINSLGTTDADVLMMGVGTHGGRVS